MVEGPAKHPSQPLPNYGPDPKWTSNSFTLSLSLSLKKKLYTLLYCSCSGYLPMIIKFIFTISHQNWAKIIWSQFGVKVPLKIPHIFAHAENGEMVFFKSFCTGKAALGRECFKYHEAGIISRNHISCERGTWTNRGSNR